MTIFQPQEFGKYQLLDRIAIGGMAELYRAKLRGEQGFEKLIAVKKILPHLSGEQELVKAFIDEAKLAAFLHHENIVQIYDFGSMDGEYFIAMEYLFGKDLRSTIRKAAEINMPLDFGHMLYIVSRVCAGLDYSHSLKDMQGHPLHIIHRDINPQNIFLTYDGQVKIIDFGIAKAASHNNTTHEGLIKGKLAYMSPEQARGEAIDHRSDIFSTGIILYELLSGERMYLGEAMQIYPLVRRGQFRAPREVIDDLSPEMDGILRRALASDPERRYQDSGQMLADLEACMEHLSSRPSTRSFAAYMKRLFEEEMAAEELTLWAKTQIYRAGEADAGQVPASDDASRDETTVVERSGQRPHGRLRTLALLLAMMTVCGILVVTFLKTVGVFDTHSRRSGPDGAAAGSAAISAGSGVSAAKASIEAGHYRRALELLAEETAGHPDRRAELKELYVTALVGRATELTAADPEQARRLLAQAVRLDPDNVSALSQLGYLLLRQKKFARAEVVYRRVARMSPRDPNVFFNLGYIYAASRDFSRAEQMYRKVVELQPSFLDEALFNLAMVQDRLGQRNLCVRNLKRALSINPENRSARRYLQRLGGK